MVREDGTKSNNRAKITNISVSEDYTKYKEKGYEIIKIGSNSSTYTGSHSYTIKYTYNIGKDPLKNADELYFNLIGDQWDTSISNVTFKITMPKEFDPSLLGFSSGKKGYVDSSNITYKVSGKVISGSINNLLEAEEALTVRLTLPEGYFVGASYNIDTYSIFVMIVCLISVLIADRLWAKYGKDDPVIETVEFYPPNGYNSAEVGFLYKGYSDTKSIVSLLIYLADKGYLKIEETSYGYEEETRQINDDKKQAARLKIQELENKIEQEKLKDINSPKIKIWENSLKIYRNIEKSTDYQVSENAKNLLNNARKDLNLKFRIIKLKEYDGNNEYEKIFFDGLFMPGSDKTSINISDLYNRFYITLDRIKEKLNSKQNKNKIFEESSNKQGIKIIPMIIAIFALITIKPVIEYSGIESLIISLIFPTIGLCVLGAILLSESTTSSKIIGIIFALLFGGIPWKIAVLPALKENNMYLITYIVGIICVATLILFIKIMPKRTPYGNEMLGKVRGFKRFLETAEKPQLEGLVERNPEYFYNILPYTYALEVSNVWIKQFETIAIQEPEWYKTDEDFDLHSFGIFIDETMSSASNAMSPSPSRDSDSSSSISSSSSGGGISGGGSGGGGGGSW